MCDWYVLYSKPRKERLLLEQLRQRGIDAYLLLAPLRGRQTTCVDRFHATCSHDSCQAPCPPASRAGCQGSLPLSKRSAARPLVSSTVLDYIRQRLAEITTGGGALPPRPTGTHPRRPSPGRTRRRVRPPPLRRCSGTGARRVAGTRHALRCEHPRPGGCGQRHAGTSGLPVVGAHRGAGVTWMIGGPPASPPDVPPTG